MPLQRPLTVYPPPPLQEAPLALPPQCTDTVLALAVVMLAVVLVVFMDLAVWVRVYPM
jgi:hypothetical protein